MARSEVEQTIGVEGSNMWDRAGSWPKAPTEAWT